MQREITVKQTGFFNKYRTIQKAVDDILPGGTIYIESGEYIENVVFHGKDVTVIGKGDAVIKENTSRSVITVRTCNVNLHGLYIIQENPSNTVHASAQGTVNIKECYLEGYKVNHDSQYPVVWAGGQSVVNIENSTLVARKGETCYMTESKMSIAKCDLKGFGIGVHNGSTLTVRDVNVQSPFSHGIYSVKSKIDVSHFEVTGGGVAILVEQSDAVVKNLKAIHQYRDVIRISESNVTVEDAYIDDFMSIKNLDKEQTSPGIPITNNSKVALKNIEIKNSPSGAIGFMHSEVDLDHVKIENTFTGILTEYSKINIKNLTAKNIECNALSIKNCDSPIIDTAWLQDFGQSRDDNFPGFFIQKTKHLRAKNIDIVSSFADGVSINEADDNLFEDMRIKGVNIGIYAWVTDLNLTNVELEQCGNQSLYTNSATVKLNNFKSHDNLKFRRNADPKKVQIKTPSVVFMKSKLIAQDLEISDSFDAMNIIDESKATFDSYAVSGNIEIKNSEATFNSFKTLNDKDVPLIEVAKASTVDANFDDPNTKIMLSKDKTSTFSSNLRYNPEKLVQVNFRKED